MVDSLCGSLPIHKYDQRVCGPERAENIWERWAFITPGDEDRIWTDHLATRFLTSILNPLVGSQLVGGLGLCRAPCSQKKHIAAVLADCDSWECGSG